MIKAAMVLKKNQIPPQLNFINPKPTLRLEERGIIVSIDWPRGIYTRSVLLADSSSLPRYR
jgi:acyl transferase domain-containing protein